MAKEKYSKTNSDQELVALTLAGHKEAFRFLVEKYQGRAYSLAFEILRSKQDAEDVVQEAFVKAFLSLSSFRGESNFYTWLYRIVFNMAIDQKRKTVRQGTDTINSDEQSLFASEQATDFKSSWAGPDDLLYRKEQAKLIESTLAELSEEHRSAFILREVEGLSYADMAKVLGVTQGTVMSRLFYARKKLMEGLQALRHNSQGEQERTKGTEVSEERGLKLNIALSVFLL